MSKFNPLPREELIQSSGTESSLLSKRCRRFTPFYQLWGDSRRGVIFLKLREEGCDKKKALAYSSKPICREDSTRLKNGPSECRALKVKNHSLLTANGWQFNELIYDLGKRFYTSADDFLKPDEFDDLLQKHFVANEEKIKGDFKKKIKNLTEFYAELNHKYNFSHLDKRQLYEKLQKIKEDNQMSKELKSKFERKLFIPCGNIKMKSLVNDTLDQDKLTPSLIKEFSVFPKHKLRRLPTEEEMNIERSLVQLISSPPKVDMSPPNEYLSKPRPSLDNQGLPNPMLRVSKIFTAESLSIPPETLLPNPPPKKLPGIDINKIKEKASLFLNLEAQNQFISAITNDNTFADVLPENKRKAVAPPPILPNPAGFPTKSLMAEEFNRANYMYGNEEEKKSATLSPKSVKQKSILKHRRTLKSIRMGFGPEDLEKQSEKAQIRQNTILQQNIKIRKKDVSFVLPEKAEDKYGKKHRISQNYFNEIVAKGKKITPFDEGSSRGLSNKPKTERKKITFSDSLQSPVDEYFPKLRNPEEKDFTYDESDEIERELKFQTDLKGFVRSSINYQNSRKGSLDINTGKVKEIMNEIKGMREENDSLFRGQKNKLTQKARNLKSMMSSTYQNFMTQYKPASNSKQNSKSSSSRNCSLKNSLS